MDLLVGEGGRVDGGSLECGSICESCKKWTTESKCCLSMRLWKEVQEVGSRSFHSSSHLSAPFQWECRKAERSNVSGCFISHSYLNRWILWLDESNFKLKAKQVVLSNIM